MVRITCRYFVTESGKVPVKEFIDSLNSATQMKFFFSKSLLEEFGHTLQRPHAAYIGDKIYELRFKGIEGAIRILYFFFHEDKVIFTNGFLKKTNKIPKNEKSLAIRRRAEFLEN